MFHLARQSGMCILDGKSIARSGPESNLFCASLREKEKAVKRIFVHLTAFVKCPYEEVILFGHFFSFQ